MEAKEKVVVNNQEYDLPEGISPLGEGLYLVDWSLIEIAKEINEEEKEFRFFNPRHLGQYELENGNDNVEVFLGQGFSKTEMRDLLTSLKETGQAYPLQGYFVENGTIKVRVHDGERRYRCIERMRDDDMEVWSRAESKFAPAKQVYEKVLIKVECMTEEEAFIRAWTISDTVVKWGDGANARLVKFLYSKGYKDDAICKMLKKSKPWLAETCLLNELDQYCFNFLLAGNINRKVALDLARVKDEKVRQTWLRDAWKKALEEHAETEAKNDKLLEKAEVSEDLANAEIEEAKEKGASPEILADLEKTAEEAKEKTQKRKQIKAASAKPMAKGKHLRQASGFLNALRPPKIKKKLQRVEELIQNNTSSVDTKVLQILKIAYQSILDGEEDLDVVLQRLSA